MSIIKQVTIVLESVDHSLDVDNCPLNYPHYLSAYAIAMLEPPAFDPVATCPFFPILKSIMISPINTDDCSNIKLEFEYLDHFLINISRPFSDCFSGEVYTNVPMYNGELFHLFSLSSCYPSIEDAIKDSFQQCDEFLIDNPLEPRRVSYSEDDPF
jgi:hypothetical protein